MNCFENGRQKAIQEIQRINNGRIRINDDSTILSSQKNAWFAYSSGWLEGPFSSKNIAITYLDHSETGKLKRIGSSHYENQYGEIVATGSMFQAMGYIRIA